MQKNPPDLIESLQEAEYPLKPIAIPETEAEQRVLLKVLKARIRRNLQYCKKRRVIGYLACLQIGLDAEAIIKGRLHRLAGIDNFKDFCDEMWDRSDRHVMTCRHAVRGFPLERLKEPEMAAAGIQRVGLAGQGEDEAVREVLLEEAVKKASPDALRAGLEAEEAAKGLSIEEKKERVRAAVQEEIAKEKAERERKKELEEKVERLEEKNEELKAENEELRQEKARYRRKLAWYRKRVRKLERRRTARPGPGVTPDPPAEEGPADSPPPAKPEPPTAVTSVDPPAKEPGRTEVTSVDPPTREPERTEVTSVEPLPECLGRALRERLPEHAQTELGHRLYCLLQGRPVGELAREMGALWDRLCECAAPPVSREAYDGLVAELCHVSLQRRWDAAFPLFLAARLPGFAEQLHLLRVADLPLELRARVLVQAQEAPLGPAPPEAEEPAAFSPEEAILRLERRLGALDQTGPPLVKGLADYRVRIDCRAQRQAAMDAVAAEKALLEVLKALGIGPPGPRKP